ncbi:MAG: hypothetical protein ACPL6D_15275 [Thermodesulfobacteriota bacterium]
MKRRIVNLKKMDSVLRLKNLVSLIAAGFLLSACALGTDYVRLYDPLTYKPIQEEGIRVAYAEAKEIKPILGEKIWVVIKKVDDKRPDPTRIGAKKNASGIKTGSVNVEKGVSFQEVFTKNLITCFEWAGYEVIPIKKYEELSSQDKEKIGGLIEGEIRFFWVTFVPGFAVVDAASNVIFNVKLFEPGTDKEIWSGNFSGKGKVSGMAVTRGMYEKSINIAYAEAMRNLFTAISDEGMKKLFKK